MIAFCAGAIELAIRLVMGGWILYRAVVSFKYAFYLKELNLPWKRDLVFAVILLIVGLYIILRSNLVLSTIGLLLIIYAVIELTRVILSIVK